MTELTATPEQTSPEQPSPEQTYPEQSVPRRRWDPIVKLTHWGMVLAIIANALVTEEGSGLHIWVGYGLAGLLALRLLWGLVGPRPARFRAFPPSPTRALRHVREIFHGLVTRHRSHNPLGALMVYAIWSCLAVIIASGIAMAGPPPADPFSAGSDHEGSAWSAASAASATGYREHDEDDDDEHRRGGAYGSGEDEGENEGDELFEEVHEIAVNLLYILIALHLAGVVFETRRSGKDIVGAMLPGGSRL